MIKKRKIKYKKERVLLSDILPFELPLSFTNFNFYKFLLRFPEDDNKIPSFINEILYKNKKYTVPYNFDIRHNNNHPRKLSIIHPKNQIDVCEFYDKYKELILYFGNNSNFSLRKIAKISSIENFDDPITDEKIVKPDRQEESEKEYYSSSSFFKYKKFSRIFRFFEDNIFYNAEKRFDKMLYIDISRCFDSVYTHSFSWSILGKDFTKKEHTEGRHKDSFTDKFDTLMQRMNYNETNGIVVGPEFSRIFAEIILQGIDREVENNIFKKLELKHSIDYKIFRYIDDYFIFYDTEDDINRIEKELYDELEKYKFFINENKKKYFNKPIITSKTVAKEEIKQFVKNEICFDLKLNDKQLEIVNGGSISANNIKKQINSIIYKNSINHDDIMNFFVFKIEKKIEKINSDLQSNLEKIDYEIKHKYEKFIWSLLDILFFFYSIKPKVNLTLRISYILSEILNILSRIKDKEISNNIHKKIYDEIYGVLKKYIEKKDKISMMESLYLLLELKELGNDYRLDEKMLDDILKLYKNNYDYIFITTFIFYIRDDQEFYKNIKTKIIKIIFDIFNKRNAINPNNDTEKVLLMFDLIALEDFLNKEEKREILSFFKTEDELCQNRVINFIVKNSLNFTNWKKYNHNQELKFKRFKNVY
ncbi:MAG: RNA-directed DNA polymerase [Candidatus Pacebacteria bacterium]|nr:RNA-directed DNA polymerase [Candidatus Paceibacterota bacterium]